MKKLTNITTVVLLLALILTQAACSLSPLPESQVHLTILHLNDIYEITSVSGGTLGGLARVASLRKQLVAQNLNTFVFFAGDLYSPSGMGTAIVEGTPLAGEQAVAIMNKLRVNYMTFGDHEIDMISEEEFYQRLTETKFPIISSNVFDANGQPFPGVAVNDIYTIANQAGREVRVGVFGVTEKIWKAHVDFTYIDPFKAAEEQVKVLDDQVDILIALTHHRLQDDIQLSKQFPAIDLILGGDEHQHTSEHPGPGLAPIYKSDSNARTVYILDLYYDTATGELKIEERLQPLTDQIPEDPDILQEVNRWVEIAFAAFRGEGFDPSEVVAPTTADLDGFSTSIRNSPNDFTNLITEGMLNAAPCTELALLYSFAIRLDDLIPKESFVTQYDVLRTFPISNPTVISVEMSGSSLKEVLELGRSSAGAGCYLLTSANVVKNRAGTDWLINSESLDPARKYQVAMTNDNPFSFCGPKPPPKLKVIQTHTDLRQSLIDQLRAVAPVLK